jgi:hypothetical protein
MVVVWKWLHWTAPTRCPRIPRVAAIRRQVPRSRGASGNSPQVPSSDLTPQSPHSLKLPLGLISDGSPGMQKIVWIEAGTVQVSQLSNTRHAVQL